MSAPSRQVRRALERRADRALARLHGTPVTCPPDVAARTHVVIATEHGISGIVHRADMVPALALLGLWMPGLEVALAEIAQAPQDDGTRIPVLLLIDGWMQCAWVSLGLLSRGGDA